MAKMPLTQQMLRDVFVYSPDSGEFFWRETRGSRAIAGGRAGGVTANGYWCIRVLGGLYQAHRLAWLYVHGQWPSEDIDHINGDRLDNRAANLRDVPNALNRQNTKRARRDSRTGLQGVTPYKKSGRFQARIKVAGKSVFLGVYDSAQLAHKRYLDAKAQLHSAWPDGQAVALTDNHTLNTKDVRRVRCDSVVGLQGVTPHGRKFRARLKTKYLGLFDSAQAAHEAFVKAKSAQRSTL